MILLDFNRLLWSNNQLIDQVCGSSQALWLNKQQEIRMTNNARQQIVQVRYLIDT